MVAATLLLVAAVALAAVGVLRLVVFRSARRGLAYAAVIAGIVVFGMSIALIIRAHAR